MTNASQFSRRLIVLVIVLPLAALIGYVMATPDQFDSLILVSLVLGTLVAPLMLKWHHPLLILAWNGSLTLGFLPGHPSLWIIVSGLSFGISVLERGLAKREVQTYIPFLVWSLVALTGVIVLTAKLSGGLGIRAMGGSTYGGKSYFVALAAILGYFALTSQRLSTEKARRWTSLFFMSSVAASMSNIIYFLGPAFYFLYLIFPVDLAIQQVVGGDLVGTGITRFTGFAIGGPALIHVMLVNFGVRGIFSLAHPWRVGAFLLCLALTLLGGFRSSLLMLFMLLVFLFFLEGLHRTKLVLYLGLAAILACCSVLPFAKHLPLAVQRSLSILPIEVAPLARSDAESSTEWRLEMWRILWPQVPQHLLLGKGCSLDPSEMYLINYAVRQGLYRDYEEALATGSYHSGPLTLLIQFGGLGAAAFLWFGIASLRVLYRHYQNAAPELKLLNTFLLAYFAMKLIYFLGFYGHFAEDLFSFTGVIGLSVSINGNGKRASALQETTQANAQRGEPLLPQLLPS